MNREQKRKIIGVAVISGVILVSVASVGITQLVKESNATQSNKYITAQATNMKASTASTTLNGITYSKSLHTRPHHFPGPGTIIASIQPVQISNSMSSAQPNILQLQVFITSFCFNSSIRIMIEQFHPFL